MVFTFVEIKIVDNTRGLARAEVTGEKFTDQEVDFLVGDHWDQVLKAIPGEKSWAIEVARAAGLTAADLE